MLGRSRKFNVIVFVAVLLAATATRLVAQQPVSSGGQSSGAVRCEAVVRLIDEPVLAAGEAGLLIEVAAEGDTVHKGQLVARTDDADAKLAQEIALWAYRAQKKEVESDIRLRYSRKQADANKAAYDNAKEANDRVRGAVSGTELRQRKFEWEASVLSIENTQHEMEVAKLNAQQARGEYERATAMLERHRIASPIEGVVMERLHAVGEYVRPGDPIVQVARLDRVKVEGRFKFKNRSPHEVRDKHVTINIQVGTNADGSARIETFESVVHHTSVDVDTMDEYRVWVEIDNRDGFLVRPGMLAEMIVHE